MPGIQLDSNVSAGPVVAADSQGSTMYPLSKLAFGAVGTFTLVTDDTAGGFPVRTVTDTTHAAVVRGLTDSHVAITSDSGNPVFVRGLTNSGIDVIIDSGDLIRIANDTGQAVPVRLISSDTQITVAIDSGDTIRIANDSTQSVPVRGPTDSTVPVSGTVTVANIDANDTVVTVTNIADNDTVITITNIADNDTVVSARIINDSATLVYLAAASSSGAAVVKATPGYLWGYYLFNPDTANKAYVHIYNDTDVTLGTDSAVMVLGLPPMGAANLALAKPIPFSAGISIAVALTANSTAHDTPVTGITTNLFYE